MCRELFTETPEAQGEQSGEHVIRFLGGVANPQGGQNSFKVFKNA